MKNYYFFKACERRNAQGEMRRGVEMLPGQTSVYFSRRESVNPELRVQLRSRDLTMVVNGPSDAIYGCVCEGNTFNRSTIKIYSRDNVKFYTVDELFCVSNNKDIDGTYYPVSEERTAKHDEIRQRYETFASSGSATATTTARATAPSPQTFGASDREPRSPSFLIGSIDRIKSYKDIVGRERLQTISHLFDILSVGVAHFFYTKADGTRREAWGTRSNAPISLLESTVPGIRHESPREFDPNNPAVLPYFDIQRRAWRSFRIDKLAGLDMATIYFAPMHNERIRQIALLSRADDDET